jgi:hypothetical protein
VPVSFGAEHDHRMEERDGGRWRLLTKRKREMGRGPARAVPCGGRRGGLGTVAPCEGGRCRGVGGLAADGVRRGGTRGQPATTGAGRCHGAQEQGNGVARVGYA